MGIRYLNQFLKNNASAAIKQCHLKELSGKKIAIDISIYIYQYASEGALIENIYLMLSTFRHYNIIPIFVFDGTPPIEKQELIQKRKNIKLEAKLQYAELENTLIMTTTPTEKKELEYRMEMLKKKMVNVSKQDIEVVKKLIAYYGATYYTAAGEADEICAMLTIKHKVWACLSDDMDMFVYGCPRVIRYLSLLHQSAVIYDTTGILHNLGITQKELREICILSGTDYNMQSSKGGIIICNNRMDLNTVLKYFKQYYKIKTIEYSSSSLSSSSYSSSFYEWLINAHPHVITDINALYKIHQVFNLESNEHDTPVIKKIKIANGVIDKKHIFAILKTDGFIFPPKQYQ